MVALADTHPKGHHVAVCVCGAPTIVRVAHVGDTTPKRPNALARVTGCAQTHTRPRFFASNTFSFRTATAMVFFTEVDLCAKAACALKTVLADTGHNTRAHRSADTRSCIAATVVDGASIHKRACVTCANLVKAILTEALVGAIRLAVLNVLTARVRATGESVGFSAWMCRLTGLARAHVSRIAFARHIIDLVRTRRIRMTATVLLDQTKFDQ